MYRAVGARFSVLIIMITLDMSAGVSKGVITVSASALDVR
jgi:hypothetical protein